MLVKRISTVQCDICQKETADLEHDLGFECDTGYAFNKALTEANWGDIWLEKIGYAHLCPSCYEKKK